MPHIVSCRVDFHTQQANKASDAGNQAEAAQLMQAVKVIFSVNGEWMRLHTEEAGICMRVLLEGLPLYVFAWTQ